MNPRTVLNWATRNVVTALQAESVQEVARRMREAHVGGVVIVEKTDDGDRPIGMVTDRDVAVEIVAQGKDASSIPVSEIMSEDLIAMRDSDDVDEVLDAMFASGIRRMPLVDRGGILKGIVTLDDLLEILTQQGHAGLSALPRIQRNWEREVRGA